MQEEPLAQAEGQLAVNPPGEESRGIVRMKAPQARGTPVLRRSF